LGVAIKSRQKPGERGGEAKKSNQGRGKKKMGRFHREKETTPKRGKGRKRKIYMPKPLLLAEKAPASRNGGRRYR